MDNLPDFSQSKDTIRNRIEGAIREKRKKHSIFANTIFIALFLFTSICTALNIKNILYLNNLTNNDLDYYALEQMIKDEQLESESVILLPKSISL